MTTDTADAISTAAASADAALARLQDIVRRISDGDLHRAHRDGGWSVAQVVSHVNVCTLLWLGDIARLRHGPGLGFCFREEVAHDALGYPPPTAEIALRQLDSTRRTLASCLPATPPETLSRTV